MKAFCVTYTQGGKRCEECLAADNEFEAEHLIRFHHKGIEILTVALVPSAYITAEIESGFITYEIPLIVFDEPDGIASFVTEDVPEREQIGRCHDSGQPLYRETGSILYRSGECFTLGVYEIRQAKQAMEQQTLAPAA